MLACGRFAILMPGEVAPDSLLPIWLYPNAIGRPVYGMGWEVTTRNMLEALPADMRGWRVMDAGTGSGILAIAAARCGAVHVAAVDIDPRAAERARQNVALNRLGGRIAVVEADVELWTSIAMFDLLLSNIYEPGPTDQILLRQPAIRRIFTKGSEIPEVTHAAPATA